MVRFQIGQLGLGLLISVGPPAVLSMVTYWLVRSATTLTSVDPRQVGSYAVLVAALVVFGWMLRCVARGLAALRQRRYEWGVGLLAGSAIPVVAYLLVR